MKDPNSDRRDVMATIATLAAGATVTSSARARGFEGPGASILLPSEVRWSTPHGAPPRSFESAMLLGDLDGAGPYVTLVRWYPGFMSAPHTYLSDRMGVVLSGIWWVDSGSDFDPRRCKAVPAGTYVQRKAGTAHYDGVVADAKEPATIAIFGIAPVGLKFVDPTASPIRKV